MPVLPVRDIQKRIRDADELSTAYIPDLSKCSQGAKPVFSHTYSFEKQKFNFVDKLHNLNFAKYIGSYQGNKFLTKEVNLNTPNNLYIKNLVFDEVPHNIAIHAPYFKFSDKDYKLDFQVTKVLPYPNNLFHTNLASLEHNQLGSALHEHLNPTTEVSPKEFEEFLNAEKKGDKVEKTPKELQLSENGEAKTNNIFKAIADTHPKNSSSHNLQSETITANYKEPKLNLNIGLKQKNLLDSSQSQQISNQQINPSNNLKGLELFAEKSFVNFTYLKPAIAFVRGVQTILQDKEEVVANTTNSSQQENYYLRNIYAPITYSNALKLAVEAQKINLVNSSIINNSFYHKFYLYPWLAFAGEIPQYNLPALTSNNTHAVLSLNLKIHDQLTLTINNEQCNLNFGEDLSKKEFYLNSTSYSNGDEGPFGGGGGIKVDTSTHKNITITIAAVRQSSNVMISTFDSQEEAQLNNYEQEIFDELSIEEVDTEAITREFAGEDDIDSDERTQNTAIDKSLLIELFGLVYRMFGELTETKKNIKSTVTWLKMKLSQISKSSDDYEAIQIQIKSYQDIIEYIENLISEAIETIDTINTLVENPNINTQDELETLSTIMRLIVDSFEEQVEIIGERLSITSTTISNIYNSHEASDIKEELESLYRRVERVKSLQEDIERLQLEQDLLVQNHAAHTQINELQEKTQAANREKKIKQMALIKAKDQLKELQQAQHSQEKHKEAISLSHDEINNHQNRINELNQAISKILANAGDLKIQFMKYINLHEKNELLQQKILSLSNSVEDQELIFQDNSINEVVREIEQNELEISSLLSKIYSFFIQNGESLVLINPDIQEMMNSIILNPEITSTQKIQSLIELVSVIAKDGASNIKELNSKINDLTHENELISVTNIDYEADIRGIQLTIQGIELEINDINQRLGVYDQQISDLRQCLNPAQQEIERFEEQYSALEETIRMSRASLTETPTIEQNLSEMQLLETRLMSIEDRDDELILENASNIMLDNLLQYQEILYWVPSYATPLVNTLLFITELSTTHAHNHI